MVYRCADVLKLQDFTLANERPLCEESCEGCHKSDLPEPETTIPSHLIKSSRLNPSSGVQRNSKKRRREKRNERNTLKDRHINEANYIFKEINLEDLPKTSTRYTGARDNQKNVKFKSMRKSNAWELEELLEKGYQLIPYVE